MPFLVADPGYSHAQVGALVLAASLRSAFLQPLLGAIADRIQSTWMMPTGLFLACAGLAGVAVFTSYAATAVALIIGLGASFVAVFGVVADRVGLTTVMWVLIGVTVVAAALGLHLDATSRRPSTQATVIAG